MPRLLVTLTIALTSSLGLSSSAASGEFNPKLNIGDLAPGWKALPGVDGHDHSLADLDQAKPVVVVFTCNSCDVAADYEGRIIAFAKKYAGQVSVVAINVSAKPADALPLMQQRAAQKKFPYAYLFDESQAIGQAYGANFTPEFFVLSAGDKRQIVYMGGMDDHGDAAQVKQRYLESAAEAALKGESPATPETAPRGCRIRYPRTRR